MVFTTKVLAKKMSYLQRLNRKIVKFSSFHEIEF